MNSRDVDSPELGSIQQRKDCLRLHCIERTRLRNGAADAKQKILDYSRCNSEVDKRDGRTREDGRFIFVAVMTA